MLLDMSAENEDICMVNAVEEGGIRNGQGGKENEHSY